MPVASKFGVKIADEVWIATALLHREQPARLDFTLEEIIERAGKEGIAGTVRPSFNTALPTAHPIPAAIEYFSRRPRGDACHSAREGAKTVPNPEDIPDRYRPLLAWYRDWCSAALKSAEGE